MSTSVSNRPDGRTLTRKIQDANFQPILANKEKSGLEKAIEDKTRQIREEKINRLPQNERIIARLKGLERDKEEAEEFEIRKARHIENKRDQISRVQMILERWMQDESTPAEWLVQAEHTIAQLSHPDGDKAVGGHMANAVYKLAEEQRNEQVAGIVAKRQQLDAMLAALADDQLAADAPKRELVKVSLTATDLDGQARELHRVLCSSTEHSFEETDAVYDALLAHRAGNSAAMIAAIERYVDSSPVESEAANASVNTPE